MIDRVGGFVALTLVLAGAAFAGPGNEAFGPAQAAADVLRTAAGTDACFLPAGMVRESGSPDNLASILQYPTDELAVVELKGAQIRAALERSVSLYPSSSTGFLQLSGVEVTFSRSAPVDKRITAVTVAGARLDDARTYSVSMPVSLARGGYGYFKIWDKNQITRTLENATLESLLKGRRATDSSSRWTIQN
ncbi:MAG TPA: 5'-nucleotidase [Fimbriimonadaceae bacterium]|nr:5'-nucleotidase [Fimbriimonadaceae bacterium]HRJ96552.1 5'-nucleotidase [Fimbriimonadaceae bacterium]